MFSSLFQYPPLNSSIHFAPYSCDQKESQAERLFTEIERLEIAASGLNGIAYSEAMRLPLREFLQAKSLKVISETVRVG